MGSAPLGRVFLHDLGYIQKENMDGPEGEEHVHLGSTIMGLIFGD
jgi:hypothetical protein